MINELKSIFRPLVASFSAAVAAGTLAGLSSVSLMGLSAWLIATAALQVPLYMLSLAIIGVRFCGIMRAVFRYLERYLSHRAGFALFTKFRVFVLRRIIAVLPFKRHTSNGDAFTIIVEAVDRLRDSFLRFFLPPVTATMVCFAVMIWTGFYSYALVWILSAAWLVFIAAVPCAAYFFYKRKEHCGFSLAEEILEFYDGGREMYVYDFSGRKLAAAKQAIDRYQNGRKSRFLLKGRIELLCEILLGMFIVFVMGTVIYLAQEQQFSAVMAIAFLLTIQSVLEILAAVPPLAEHLDEGRRNWQELKSFMNGRKVKQATGSADGKKSGAVLDVENITFGYAKPLCRNMSFSLHKGQKILLVGSSGCGKSTLFYVLTGLLDIFSGDMYLQGKNYLQWNKQAWRSHFAASFQEHHIFNLSIRENFKIFYPDITDEEIWQALDKAEFTDFVRLHGLDYILTGGGTNLSGGQKHRLQLAISLAGKKDIILLDEPTAGLDIVSSHKIMRRIVSADKEAALLVASHDLSMADYFDDVIIMENGTIKEQGSIKMLMQSENSYLHRMMKYNNLI